MFDTSAEVNSSYSSQTGQPAVRSHPPSKAKDGCLLLRPVVSHSSRASAMRASRYSSDHNSESPCSIIFANVPQTRFHQVSVYPRHLQSRASLTALCMPRYYCDYCDVFLTHDSAAVRGQHNRGLRHRDNVRDYYQKLAHEMGTLMCAKRSPSQRAQSRINGTT